VASRLELGNKLFLEFKTSVIRGKSYAHGKTLVFPRPKTRGKRCTQIGLRRGAEARSILRMYLGVHQMKA
jgi:hypothetical protein